MPDVFSEEWLKSSVASKRKSLALTSSLEQLYVLILVEGQSLKEKLEHEVNELGLNPAFCIDNNEAERLLNKYGSKVIMVVSNFDLSDPVGRAFRQLVLENTNDTPFAILTDLNAFEIDNSNNVTEEGYDLTPHVYMAKNLPHDIWYSFLRFDVLTRISLLGEEVKLRGAFMQNSENIIQNIEELVLSLDDNPDTETLDTIFGNIHTLKGGSSFLQPKNLERFMHKFEDLINKLRLGELMMTSEVITAMLKVLDKSKELIEDLGAHFHHEYEEGELASYFSAFTQMNPLSEDKLSNENNLTKIEADVPSEETQSDVLISSIQEQVSLPDKAPSVSSVPELLTVASDSSSTLIASTSDSLLISKPEPEPEAVLVVESDLLSTSEIVPNAASVSEMESPQNTKDLISELKSEESIGSSSSQVAVEFIPEDKSEEILIPPSQKIWDELPVATEEVKAVEPAPITAVSNTRLGSPSNAVLNTITTPSSASSFSSSSSSSFSPSVATAVVAAPLSSDKKANSGDHNSKGNPPPNNKKKDDKNLKVPISLLDTLMHISGELTVVRNMINKIDRSLKVRYNGDRELERMSSLLEELHKLNGSLQTHILDLRKVPVKEIVAPLNRVVRDLSKQLDKVVTLKVQGSELRIDTAIAEILNNTLIHIVRNSIDHGLESTHERLNNGKPQGGSLCIDAYEENDNVYVRIRDDGRGLQTERIRSRAIDRGLLTEEQATALKEEDVWPLIFAPGFSTAEKVTDISGRGIGMSAVKEAVEAIDGEVEISSVLGQGSTITLSMPLPKSVLITRCLFILISGMQLGIPNENVYRIVHLDGETDTAQLSQIEDTYVLSLEEELIPVVQLDQVLGTSKVESADSKVKTIVVLRSSKGAAIGVIVNDVLEFEDAVVKPFTDHLKAFDIFFGTTFLGDGSIGLIFRVDGLVEVYRAKQFYRFNINFKARENFFQEVAG